MKQDSILKEHEKVITQFQEDHSDEITLLQLYRDFIVANNLDPFFEFTNAYSSYIISQREKRGGFANQFTVSNLRRLIMSSGENEKRKTNYAEILDKPGFQNVARAIRESTVKAQWEKAKKRANKPADTRYDIRYGLGQELIRRSQYPDQFLSELAVFLQTYNAENAQVKERDASQGKDVYKTYFRRDVYESDWKEIVDLVDRHGSDLICKLLVAFGYARESRESQELGGEDETPTG